MDFKQLLLKDNGQNAHQISNNLPLQDLCSPISTDFSNSPSSTDSAETKEALPISSQSKKISKGKPSDALRKSKLGLWSSVEDSQLVNLVEKYGQKWTVISDMMPGKGRKQVRDRYVNALRPGINWGEWTKEEEEQFEVLHDEFGNRWCDIAANMPGRTENQVKNKYYWAQRQQPPKKKGSKGKSKGKKPAKKAKVNLSAKQKEFEKDKTTTSENQTGQLDLSDKILSETEIERISSPDNRGINYSEQLILRLESLEDKSPKDFVEEKSSQQASVQQYKDIDSYFCF